MKISKQELEKPIRKKKDGTFATLEEVKGGDIILKEKMTSEDFVDLAIARYKTMDPLKATVVGKVSYTKSQIIDEIKSGSEVGMKFVRMQTNFVQALLDKTNEIEFT